MVGSEDGIHVDVVLICNGSDSGFEAGGVDRGVVEITGDDVVRDLTNVDQDAQDHGCESEQLSKSDTEYRRHDVHLDDSARAQKIF